MTTFALTDEHAQMGKISNNLEKHGEDELITGFTLPLELSIPRPQLVVLMGKDFDASAWKADNTPADWLRRLLPIELMGEVYVGVAAALVLNEEVAELEFADCRVTHVTLLAFAPGGITRVSCHLYLRPGIGDENLLLQEYQGKEIAVQLTSGKLRVKADKAQQQLPFAPPAPASAVQSTADSPPTHDHPTLHIDACHCGTLEDHLGSPEDERERAHAKERMIARQIQAAHDNGEGPGDDDEDEEDEGEMSALGQQIGNAERKGPKRAGRRSTVNGDAVN